MQRAFEIDQQAERALRQEQQNRRLREAGRMVLKYPAFSSWF
jgi:hypothetical protein